jgi:hypothetical protein
MRSKSAREKRMRNKVLAQAHEHRKGYLKRKRNSDRPRLITSGLAVYDMYGKRSGGGGRRKRGSRRKVNYSVCKRADCTKPKVEQPVIPSRPLAINY